jgi:hypothetical protein
MCLMTDFSTGNPTFRLCYLSLVVSINWQRWKDSITEGNLLTSRMSASRGRPCHMNLFNMLLVKLMWQWSPVTCRVKGPSRALWCSLLPPLYTYTCTPFGPTICHFSHIFLSRPCSYTCTCIQVCRIPEYIKKCDCIEASKLYCQHKCGSDR